jgi:hypothetical protein
MRGINPDNAPGRGKTLTRRRFLTLAAAAAGAASLAGCSMGHGEEPAAISDEKLKAACSTPTPPLSAEDEALRQKAIELASTYSRHLDLRALGIEIEKTEEGLAYWPYVNGSVPNPEPYIEYTLFISLPREDIVLLYYADFPEYMLRDSETVFSLLKKKRGMENETYATEHANKFVEAVSQRAAGVVKFFNKVYGDNLSRQDFNNDVFPIPEDPEWYKNRIFLVPRQGRWVRVNIAFGASHDFLTSPLNGSTLIINCTPEELEPVKDPNWRDSAKGAEFLYSTARDIVNIIIDQDYLYRSKYYDIYGSDVENRLSGMSRNFLMNMALQRAGIVVDAKYNAGDLAPITVDQKDFFESLVKVASCEGMTDNQAFAWALKRMGQYSVHPGMASDEARKLWEATNPPYSFDDLIAGKHNISILETDKYPDRSHVVWVKETMQKACQLLDLPSSVK